MNPSEYWKSIRQMLDHENTLVNNRYTWMLASQSLLFAALGVFWGKELFVEIIICIVGLVSTISVGYSLYLADRAIRNLLCDWRKYSKGKNVSQLPPMYGLTKKWSPFGFPWLIVPPTVALAWLAIILWRALNIVT